MKRYLPLLLFFSGTLLLIGTLYFFVLRKPATEETLEEEGLIEVSLIDRPIASLSPSQDGHWLKLRIEKLLSGAGSLDYELLYTLPDERDLLLGSESSGKFRYDEGVEEGTLTLRFRNEKGKLLAKFSTKFHLQSAESELTSADGKLVYTLAKIPSKTFFVTMETFGIAKAAPGEVSAGPYGIFSSGKSAYPGTVELSGGTIYTLMGGSWTRLEAGEANDIGIFIAVSE
ncbi:MAG: hypothetical protein UW61_C0042G0003 [Candidatus Curtissbacteria bacterium GW2011_GWC1_44_33]|uniref:Uncharacterized protein n=1 Tax=Candidatus Curtissbacteria bacterium GW2011_GWC1_44_33 TaxID=1618413 RepID=A0A0G1J238_9BACT|nr:MAG: hypothetical protein UW61_C0042G0003 [Candidatus Curtissbacteria bacterium GW2011_GWC1_44_33]